MAKDTDNKDKKPKESLKGATVDQIKEKFKKKELIGDELAVEMVARLGVGPAAKEMIEMARPSNPFPNINTLSVVGNFEISATSSVKGKMIIKKEGR